MQQATIEVRTKPAIKFDFGIGQPQHTFILHTDSSGKQVVFRGGPERKNPLWGDIKVTEQLYIQGHPDHIKDWETKFPGVIIAQGSDAEMQGFVEKMRVRMYEINKENYDYKFPGVGHLQNCNTATKELLQAAGLKLRLPSYTDGKKTWFPGIDYKFDHTVSDQTIKFLNNLIKHGFTNPSESLDPITVRNIGDNYFIRAKDKKEAADIMGIPIENIVDGSFDPLDQTSIFGINFPKDDKKGKTWESFFTGNKDDRGEDSNPFFPSNNDNNDRGSGNNNHNEKSGKDSYGNGGSSNSGSGNSNDNSNTGGGFFSNAWGGFRNFWGGGSGNDFSAKPSDSNFGGSSYSPIFNYEPSFLGKPLFDIFNPLGNNRIYEPSWLYDDGKNGDYLSAEMQLRRSIQACLNGFCEGTANDLINGAVSSISGITFAVDFEMRSILKSKFSHLVTEITGSSFGGYLGSWTNPLRYELKYAASHVSPLVLDLNGDGVKLFPYTKGVYFDIDNDGFKEKVGWVSPEDGQLARDLNSNGKIDDITELFGDDLISAFLKLSLLDSNGNKVIAARCSKRLQ